MLEIIKTAIETRQTLHFTYSDKPRVVEAHAVGKTSKGSAVVRGYQLGDEPGWKLFTIDKISDLTLSFEPISQAPRDGYVMNDKFIPEMFAQIIDASLAS